MLKRTFDIISALVLCVFILPVLLILILIVRFTLGSPIIFKQQRVGRLGNTFYVYKLRTMKNIFDPSGNMLPDELRLTSMGKFLRKWSLDELPQLINILRGEISFVGPRPLLVEYLPLYNDFQIRRLEVLPGITGWAQVNGRNNLSWDEKFKLDVWYVDNQSFWLDLKILLLTVKKIFDHTDISSADHATMPKFTGNSTDGE